MKRNRRKEKDFFLKIIFSTALAIILFIASIFTIIIPAFRENMLDRKREMIRELTDTAWSVLSKYYAEEKTGLLTGDEARRRAISDIRSLRYGDELKDYFWINDMRPVMIMHPYLAELEQQDLSDYADLAGKKFFAEFVNVVKESGAGYVEYMWQWKDDPEQIVPKLSYVKGFKPWDWIIGTGIYIEDVKEEIGLLTRRLINISVGIGAVIALLLLFITQQSLKIERRRRQAEEDLHESRDKYRALVEAGTDGTIMVLDGRCIIANKTMLDMLGYKEDELDKIGGYDIIPGEGNEGRSGIKYFKDLVLGKTIPPQFEAKLKKKDGQLFNAALAISKIFFGGKHGFIIIVKDINLYNKLDEELEEGDQKFSALMDKINTGVFRITAGHNRKLLEANQAAMKILGVENNDELRERSLLDYFQDERDRDNFASELSAGGAVKNSMVQLRKENGEVSTVFLSAVVIEDENGAARYCDGTIEDITERKRTEEERENFIAELQVSMLFFHKPVKDHIRESIVCGMSTTIENAAGLMVRNNCSSALIASESGEIMGIITDHDMRERVIAGGDEISKPVFEIMSSPLITIPDSALIFKAMSLMQEKNVQHLAVQDKSGKITGVIRNQDILRAQRYCPALLLNEINDAGSIEEIVAAQKRLPRLVKTLTDCGANPNNITSTSTAVSNSIVDKLIRLAIDELGPPPAKFTFMALGSEGREEQTLKTDQDNALIYEDLPEECRQETTDYFPRLGEKVCAWLDRAGYAFCNGDVMARNPKFCLPLSKWKEQFKRWITEATPQDFREFNIFFDFRCVYGEMDFTGELKSYIKTLMHNNAAFFRHFAEDVIQHKPPLGIFGKIVVETSGDKPKTFSIKDAILPIVNFARLYALHNGVDETNTLDRLRILFEKGIINKVDYQEVVVSYNYLMLMRFKHQAMAAGENLPPDNDIDPGQLTSIEKTTLKHTFSRIATIQKKISFDFIGGA